MTVPARSSSSASCAIARASGTRSWPSVTSTPDRADAGQLRHRVGLLRAVLGFFHSPLMALTSALKLPLLFLVTLAICLPTLYLFNLVFGARLSVRQSLALVMVAITVTSMLAVAFAPISLFFLITADDYGFFKLLNVAILTLSAIVGLRF
ncbi:hypothetical protein NKG94_32440 [Micromonospora sp. M12]